MLTSFSKVNILKTAHLITPSFDYRIIVSHISSVSVSVSDDDDSDDDDDVTFV